MKQQYFILVLAHSLHGRLRRIHIPHQVLYIVLALAMVGGFSIFGFVSSYARMAWKVANYNSLQQEADAAPRPLPAICRKLSIRPMSSSPRSRCSPMKFR